MRTMSFYAIACETDHHPSLVPAGNIGNSAASDDFTWCARRTRRWGRAAGVAAYLHADFATAWVARLLLPVGDSVWWAGGGRQGRVRAVVPAGQSLADGSAPFFTRFALQAALAFSLETGAPFGEGGCFHRTGPGPILSR